MIWVHTGGKYCGTWDEKLKSALARRGLSFQESDFTRVGDGHLLVGRLNEFSGVSKTQYRATLKRFRRSWPESQVYDLYDDKLLQLEFFSKYGFPHPKTVYYTGGACDLSFPVVQKLRHGSASKNVELVGEGQLVSGSLLQEFCEGNDRDFRLVVIGDKAMGFERLNRPGSFKASGSGLIQPVSALPQECVDVGRETCRLLRATTMCFDFVKLRGEWVVLEMSYTYQYEAVAEKCNFYLEGDRRVDRHPDPADMVVESLVGRGVF